MGLYTGGLNSGGGGGLIYKTTFVSEAFHTCYLYLKNEEWNKTKKQGPCSKMPLYYLTATKTRDVFPSSRLLASLRLTSLYSRGGGDLYSEFYGTKNKHHRIYQKHTCFLLPDWEHFHSSLFIIVTRFFSSPSVTKFSSTYNPFKMPLTSSCSV